ncbi:MAG: GNAT family N-acetyltransferase [Steroidobacteraceae bacterium]
MKAPSRIDTARLTLVAPTADDARDIFERYASDAEVTRYLGWPRHRTLDDTHAFLTFCAGQWQHSAAGAYLIRSRSDGRLLGSTGLTCTPPGEAMTGYVLARDAWNCGYATEALRAMIDLGRKCALRRLYALCHPQHRASARVLEKCLFSRDDQWNSPTEFPNLAPGSLQDAICYQLPLLAAET